MYRLKRIWKKIVNFLDVDFDRKYRELEESYIVIAEENKLNYNRVKKLEVEVTQLNRLLEDYKVKLRKVETENRRLVEEKTLYDESFI